MVKEGSFQTCGFPESYRASSTVYRKKYPCADRILDGGIQRIFRQVDIFKQLPDYPKEKVFEAIHMLEEPNQTIFTLRYGIDRKDQLSVEEIVSNIEKIISEISNNEPQAEIYVESIYPVNDSLDEEMVDIRNNDDIIRINKKIKKYCENNDYTYINMYDILVDEDGNFNEKYTDDGLHPNENGYEIITKELKKYLD